jgi:peroxiredoxin Q/BCP
LDAQGRTHQLSDYAGGWLVLYFYPKDDTPGCTTEACSLRDARDDLANLGAQVVGVSTDHAGAHQKFARKHSLNFTLLCDPEHAAIEAYGAWGRMLGMKMTQRKTFLIDPNGQVVKVFEKVTPSGHGGELIAALSKLQRGDNY